MNSVSPGHFAKAKPGGQLIYVYAVDESSVYYLTISQIGTGLKGIRQISAIAESAKWDAMDRPSDMRVWVAISEALGPEWDHIMI
jgi:hypothetical protein